MSLRIAPEPGRAAAAFPELAALLRALGTCVTEADIAQVLYARLTGPLGYDVVNLQVLEREGWIHRVVVDQGVLQDVRRLPVSNSYFEAQYRAGVIHAGHFEEPELEYGRGPGRPETPRTFIWVPVHHRDQLVAAVIYQMHDWRLVDDDEIGFLEELHQHLGPLIVSAYLHQLTRNQALSLGALNDLAGQLARTNDEPGIANALLATLGNRVGIDALEIVVPARGGREMRAVRAPATNPRPGESTRRRDLASLRRVLSGRRPLLVSGREAGGHCTAYVPILGERRVDAVLVAHNHQHDAYEESTLEFLGQVSDHVATALHNAWSFAVREEQRRRLEAVAAVGRRLAGAVDRPTVVKGLRDELAAHLGFDVFTLALVEERDGVPMAETYVIEHDQPMREAAWLLEREGPVWEVMESGTGQVLRGATSRALGPPGGLLREGHGSGVMRSHLVVPVHGPGEPRCGIILQAARADVFGPSDVRLLEDLGGHLRLALRTADLFGRMRVILRHSPVGVVLQDGSGLVSFVNPAVEGIYGLPPERLIGRPATYLLDEAVAAPLEGEPEDRSQPRRYRLATRDVVVEVRTVDVPAEGDRPASVLQLHEDVTREQTLLEAKDLMLRAIGHEVRSPAAAIRTTIAVLVDWLPSMTPEQQRALLEGAYEQSERLLHIAEAQLMIAKLEQGDLDLEAQAVEVREALERVRDLLFHRYGDRALSVAADLDPDLPPAMAIPTHFDEVLTNLIGNALEHTDSGAIRVVARSDGDGDWLRIAVEDHGAGLPSHRVNRLFERGGPPGSHRARGGLGLGLYLCRLIVERSFGGRIEVTRTGQDGTTIEFTAPARRARVPAAAGSRP